MQLALGRKCKRGDVCTRVAQQLERHLVGQVGIFLLVFVFTVAFELVQLMQLDMNWPILALGRKCIREDVCIDEAAGEGFTMYASSSTQSNQHWTLGTGHTTAGDKLMTGKRLVREAPPKKKTVYIWALPKLQIRALCGINFLPKMRKFFKQQFDYGNEYFDSD